MTERNHSDADSNRDVQDKRNAEVLDTSGPRDDPDVYLVEYPDGSVEYEPSTPRNVALFEDGLYERVQGHTEVDVSVGDGSVTVALDADVGNSDFTLSVDGQEVPVPREHITDLIQAFNGARGAALGSRLYNIYEEIIEGQVRRHVIQQFEDRFPSERVEVTPDGWVIDDTFVVTYEAENHLVETTPVSPHGDGFDEDKQAVYLDLNARGVREVQAPSGDFVELDAQEQEFLTMVEGLLYPEDYFDAELVDEVQQHKAESEALDDVIEQVAEQTEVTGFTDPKTGIHHGTTSHSFQKHRLSDLGVTDEVADLLWANDYDHAGVHELALRRDELVTRPDLTIFEDAPDDDEAKWDKIERTRENAPIPPRVQDTLEQMYSDE